MRVLVYGMQSSGASLFSFFLAQRPGAIAVIDLWDGFVAPDFADVETDVILKCVVAPVVPLEKHLASFKPDVTILFVRSEESNLESLSRKGYKNDGGKMDEKFAQLRTHMEQKELFDHVIDYEGFLHDRSKTLTALGALAAPNYYEFKRTKQDILNFNRSHSAWCRKYYRRRWGFGNVHFERDGTVKLGSKKRGQRKTGVLERLYHKFLRS